MPEKAISACLIARFVSINHYNKLAMRRAVDDAPWAQFGVSSSPDLFKDPREETKGQNADKHFSVHFPLVRLRIDEEIHLL